MSEVIKRGVIIIDLQQGKTEIKAPDLGPVLAAREKELKLVDELEVATRKAWEAQDKLAKVAADQQAAQQIAEQEAAMGRLADAQARSAKSVELMASGFFRVSRAAVLLGSSSDESLQKMITGLALVQGYFDLYKGTQQIIKGLTMAEEALAVATAAETAATTANTGAHVANAAAKQAATAATIAKAAGSRLLAAATNPVTLGIILLTSVVMAAVEAWDYFTESEAEAAEKAQRMEAAAQALTAAFRQQADAMRQVADLQRESMAPGAKADALRDASFRAQGRGQVVLDVTSGQGAGAELAGRRAAASHFSDAANDLKAERDIRKQILDQELQKRDEQIKQIQNQEKIVQQAKEALAIEKDKVRSFQAQVGSLSEIEQKQLKAIRDKLKAGQDISKFEEEILAQNAGEAGQGIVDARRAKRAEAAGFGSDFFKGIEGEGMSKGLADASKALNEAAKKLLEATNGKTAAAKIAELEQEKTNLNAKYQEFIKEFDKMLAQLVAKMIANNKRIAELEISAAANAHHQ